MNDGQMKIKLSAGDFALFVTDLVNSFNLAAKEKNITLSFTVEKIESLYLFDENKWEKIIINLLSNALKFTPVDGRIDVRLTAAVNDAVRLEVTDNGPGIPVDEQEKVFDRFYQVDNSSTRAYQGTGIGLSLVKEFAALMKGDITLESEPGKSTCFRIEMPLKKVGTAESISRKQTLSLAENLAKDIPDNSPLLLIVEDNEELRSFLVESLNSNYRVTEAANGIEAWEIIIEELPDIIVSDVMMPEMDGFELCRLCKTDNRTSHIGFILLTSKAAHSSKVRGLENGCDDFITKPFHLDELELRIANLLQAQHKIRADLERRLLSTQPKPGAYEVENPFLKQLFEEMDAKLDDPELGVDYLCKKMAMSRSTLNRKLKSLLNISTNDLIRQHRLQTATTYLSTGMDITTACYKVGFSSPSYFSQCFKEHYGTTPSDYVLNQN
jgi:DNA-binding response OmpR family regulator